MVNNGIFNDYKGGYIGYGKLLLMRIIVLSNKVKKKNLIKKIQCNKTIVKKKKIQSIYFSFCHNLVLTNV